MEMDGASYTETPGSPSLRQEEAAENDGANAAESEQAPSTASNCLSEDNEGATCVKDTNQPVTVTMEEKGFTKGINDEVVLSEVRSSLQTMSTGVEELVATVNDLLGLSDSDSQSSDCSFNSDGDRHFSWSRFKENTRRRRQKRRRLNKDPFISTKTAQGKDFGAEAQLEQYLKKKVQERILQTPREIIPQVRDCNFEQFQSRPAGKQHKLHCVDALIADDSIQGEIRAFRAVIGKIIAGENTSWKPDHSSRWNADSNNEAGSKKWIQRIRVNSTAVLIILQHVCQVSEDLGRGPMTFSRPFQLLVNGHEAMQAQLAKMRQLGSSSEAGERTIDTKKSVEMVESSATQGDYHDELIQKLCEDTNAVHEMACFVEFMEDRIMPDARRYRNPSSSQAQKIRFQDLWYLFKHGDLIYIPKAPSYREPIRSSPSAQSIFRVRSSFDTFGSQSLPLTKDGEWRLVCDFIDYDGAAYVPVAIVFGLSAFVGEKKVTELECYPVSYLENSQIMAQAQLNGATYVSLIDQRFGFYRGWTRTTTVLGEPVGSTSGDTFRSAEHIEGDILVDYQETFNTFPDWKLHFQDLDNLNEKEPRGYVVREHEFNMLEWDDAGQVHYGQVDLYVFRDLTSWLERRTFLETNPFGLPPDHRGDAPTGELLALLPTRVFAYAVLERKFVQVDIRSVRGTDREANDKAFKELEINPSYKRLILALVKSHFDKIETEKRTNVEIETQDLIRGKGKGVVILLHGVPGVGKTATAEAVALKWNKPLFPITCGDLGYTAETLERSLNEIFRVAHHWGCILLLDEADVFITQRERHDLKRNALVSGKYNIPASNLICGDSILTFLKPS